MAYSQASALDLAQRNCESSKQVRVSAAAAPETQKNVETHEFDVKTQSKLDKENKLVTSVVSKAEGKCSFCGYSIHLRQNYQAGNAICYRCKKEGTLVKRQRQHHRPR